MLQLAVARAANLCQNGYEDYQQICGEATGNFQLLGSFCFPGGESGELEKNSVTVSLTFSDVDSPILPLEDLNQYFIYFYDDQEDSFAAINRITEDGDYQNCTERQAFAKKICTNNVTCIPGLTIIGKNKVVSGSLTTYSKPITLGERYSREWYFVLASCLNSPIKIHNYTMTSDDAIDCSTIYQQSDAGYIAAVVILTLAMVALGVVSYIFYKRTKIPELLSMDDTGYNEL